MTSTELPISGWARINSARRHHFVRDPQSAAPLMYNSLCGRYSAGEPLAEQLQAERDLWHDCMHCSRSYRKLHNL